MKKKFLFLTLLLPYVSTISGCARAYTVTIINNNEDMGEVVGGGKFKANTSVTITATPFDGYILVNWTNEYGNRVSSREKYTFVVDSNITLYANFDYKDYGVTVESTQGYIEGNGNHKYMSDVSLKATPVSGYKFVSWNDENGNVVSRDNPYNFAMPKEDLKFTAVFEDYLIEFGKYHKTVVTNQEIVSELDKIDTVNERGYIEYNGKEFKKSKSSGCGEPEEYLGTFSDGTPIAKTATDYYFEVEPITWEVLEETEDAYLVWTHEAIDYLRYSTKTNDKYESELDNFKQSYYQYSDIREYLTGDFLTLAFTEDELSKIKETTLSDPMEDFPYNADLVYSATLTDKVFIPSKAEFEKYHRFNNSGYFSYKNDEWIQVTDYAFSLGYPFAYEGYNLAEMIMTRTPYGYRESEIYSHIYTMTPFTVSDWYVGHYFNIVPMMWISK